MFNSRLIDQKIMTKSNIDKSKVQQLVFCDTIARRKQLQLERFLQALNEYYASKIERNNVTIEVNCAFQLNDLFEPIALKYFVTQLGTVQRLPQPHMLHHTEGNIINIVFVDARKPDCVAKRQEP